MVCHESYKDKNGNWLYPDEVEVTEDKKYKKKTDSSEVIVGPPESMSKSKKNTIDPEKMISKYGADSVRWFILSDSPPEKDVQWSNVGVSAANKFLQKIWNLSVLIQNRKIKQTDEKIEKRFLNKVSTYIFKVDKSIKDFRFNVSIALFYELISYLIENIDQKISKNLFKNNFISIMILLIPFVPHLSREILEKFNAKEPLRWPKINENQLLNEIKFAVQVNGKTRDIITINKDESEKNIYKIVKNRSKVKKYIEGKTIIKTIFVKNKIVNYIIKNNE